MKVKKKYTIKDLIKIVEKLRSPDGCPWDKKQTHFSIREHLIEETYEVIDAINKKNSENLKEELGDLLLHIVFHTQIEKEKKSFEFEDITTSICKKLIRRHPHVFGNIKVKDTNEVIKNWEEIKSKEKGKENRKTIMDNIPDSMPPLSKAKKILDIAYQNGFYFRKDKDILKKIKEEIKEFSNDVKNKKNSIELENEFGDILFSLIILAKHHNINPDSALNRANKKFIKRFTFIEKKLKKQNKKIKDENIKNLLNLWNEAKKIK